jgi:predicted Fe-Mo cluster-binding NifX family protein
MHNGRAEIGDEPWIMKAAFAHWDNRIAPVFDVARQLHVVETEADQIVAESEEALADGLPVHKVLRLVELRIDTLVCGAISRPLHEMIALHGIRVVPFVAGDLREIVDAWLGGGLPDDDTHAMPGCRERRRRRHRGAGPR